MKKQPITIFILTILFLSIHPIAFATTVDYKSDAIAQVNRQTNDINTFISFYQQNKLFLNDIQRRQIESQYASLLSSLATIQKAATIDTGVNLQQDDQQALPALNTYKIRLPILYSELLLGKSTYFYQKMNEINNTLFTKVIAQVAKSKYQSALNISQHVSFLLVDAANNMQIMQNDYTQASQLESSIQTDNAKEFAAITQDMKMKQQQLLKDFSDFNTSFNDFINLSV